MCSACIGRLPFYLRGTPSYTFERDIPKGQGAIVADNMSCWDTSEHGTRRTIDFLNPYKEALQR